jgi:hypothetical protein
VIASKRMLNQAGVALRQLKPDRESIIIPFDTGAVKND